MVVKKAACREAYRSRHMNNKYFGLARSFKQKVRDCVRDTQEKQSPQVIYLWVCVTSAGLKQGVRGEPESEHPLTQEQWLNVVDEASSLGANWLVLSMADPLSRCPHIWDICVWAQQTHNMMVGLHLKNADLSPEDVKAIKKLDLQKTRLLVRKDAYEQLRWVEESGLKVWTANPQPDGEHPDCQGPTRMIFVNAQGILYTCGLVEGNDAYRMGHVSDASLRHIISNPDLPHHVHGDLHIVTPECDGCPSLMANFFSENI